MKEDESMHTSSEQLGAKGPPDEPLLELHAVKDEAPEGAFFNPAEAILGGDWTEVSYPDLRELAKTSGNDLLLGLLRELGVWPSDDRPEEIAMFEQSIDEAEKYYVDEYLFGDKSGTDKNRERMYELHDVTADTSDAPIFRALHELRGDMRERGHSQAAHIVTEAGDIARVMLKLALDRQAE